MEPGCHQSISISKRLSRDHVTEDLRIPTILYVLFQTNTLQMYLCSFPISGHRWSAAPGSGLELPDPVCRSPSHTAVWRGQLLLTNPRHSIHWGNSPSQSSLYQWIVVDNPGQKEAFKQWSACNVVLSWTWRRGSPCQVCTSREVSMTTWIVCWLSVVKPGWPSLPFPTLHPRAAPSDTWPTMARSRWVLVVRPR